MMAEAQAQAEATTRDAEARRRTFDADADLIWRERTRLIDDTRKLADCMLSVADDAVERFPPETVEPVDARGDPRRPRAPAERRRRDERPAGRARVAARPRAEPASPSARPAPAGF